MDREIGDLLAADAANIQQTKRLFDGFDPSLLGAFDQATRMFSWFGALMGRHFSDSDDLQELNRCGQAQGARDGTELEAIRGRRTNDVAHRKLLDRIQRVDDRMLSRRLRGVVFTMIDRAYHWAVSDLLRMRLTPAIGYQRIEAEALALICRMRDHPHIARKWMEIGSDDEGVAFYRRHQSALREAMAKAKLDFAYDSASGIALHVRFAGAAHGFRQETREHGPFVTHTIKVLCQELDPELPHVFLAQALGFVRTQDRIFAALPDAFPEVQDQSWHAEAVPTFTRLVDALGERFAKRFPAHVDCWVPLLQVKPP